MSREEHVVLLEANAIVVPAKHYHTRVQVKQCVFVWWPSGVAVCVAVRVAVCVAACVWLCVWLCVLGGDVCGCVCVLGVSGVATPISTDKHRKSLSG